MKFLLLLAQTDTPAPAQPQTEVAQETTTKTTAPGEQGQGQTKKKPGGFGDMMLPLILMFVVIYFVMFRGQKKKQTKQKQMLANLKKNDRVRTIGGIIGTVVDVRDDEVVLKIDEATNSKIRLARSAVSTIFTNNGTKTG